MSIKNVTVVKIGLIDVDDSTYQYRSTLDQGAIADYATVNPDDFAQPVELLAKTNGRYAILSGHHRIRGFEQAGRSECRARVYKDLPESEALIKSIQANSNHGVRVTAADKKIACQRLFLKLQEEGRSITNRQIARYTGLSDPTVERYRKELVDEGKLKDAETRTDSTGRERCAKRGKKVKPTRSSLELFKEQVATLAMQAASIDISELSKLPAARRRGFEAELKAYIEEIQKVIDSADDFAIAPQVAGLAHAAEAEAA